MTIISLDTETTGLELFHDSSPFFVSTMDEEGKEATWEFPVDPHTRTVIYDSPSRANLRDYLNGNTLVFANAKFDLRALAKMGLIIHSDYPRFSPPPPVEQDMLYMAVDVPCIHDVLLMSHVCNSQGADKRHGLKPLAMYYLDIPESDEKNLRSAVVSARKIARRLKWKTGKDLHGEPAPQSDYWLPAALYWAKETNSIPFDVEIPEEWKDICSTYAVADVYRTIGLYFFFQEILSREGLQHAYDRELRLLPATYMMEHVGMHLYRDKLEEAVKDFGTKYSSMKIEAENILSQFTGKPVNANSPLQLADALISAGVALTKRTAPTDANPSGQWVMDAPTLREIAHSYDSADSESDRQIPRSNGVEKQVAKALRLIVGWHSDSGDDVEVPIPGYKTYKTGVGYCNNYLDLLDNKSLVHPSFIQIGTSWTRYSCSEPNGQNISTKAVLPLRKLFGPPKDYVWLAVDYSQLELRIFAYAAGDKYLIEALSGGKDFHAETASQLYNLPPDKISKEQRTIAKNVNFGIIYGAGPNKIDSTTGNPGTYQLYMNRFPDARKFMQRAIADVESTGFTHTLFKYRLYVPSDKNYAVVNAIVQGTAGDIVKNAMVEIYEKQLVDYEPPSDQLPYGGSAMVANIHDEIIFQFPKSYPYQAIGKRIMQVMEKAGERLGVVTPVDGKLIFTNWAEGVKFV